MKRGSGGAAVFSGAEGGGGHDASGGEGDGSGGEGATDPTAFAASQNTIYSVHAAWEQVLFFSFFYNYKLVFYYKLVFR
jgi:hypothetical protein